MPREEGAVDTADQAGEYSDIYFEAGEANGVSCYTNYHWMPEMTMSMTMAIIDKLQIGQYHKILDFGCAKGFMVYAFRLLRRQAWGCDISEYATSHCPAAVTPFIRCCTCLAPPHGDCAWCDWKAKFDFIISKDVFEHVPEDEVGTVLQRLHNLLKPDGKCFFVIPLGDGEKYYVPEYELDVTHKIRRPMEWWNWKFVAAGFHVWESVYQINGVKDNWAKYERGNGFFTLTKIN